MAVAPPYDGPLDIKSKTIDVGTGTGTALERLVGEANPDDGVARRLETVACYAIAISAESYSTFVLGTEELRRELRAVPDTGSGTRRLVVLHGLPVEYTSVLGDEYGVDAGWVASLSAGRGTRRQRAGRSPTVPLITSYEFPEPMKGARAESEGVGGWEQVGGGGTARDLDFSRGRVSRAAVETLFCRATLLEDVNVNMLFLNRSISSDKSCFLEKSRPEDAESFERRLWQYLEEKQEHSFNLSGTLELLAYEQWVDFFEALRPGVDSSSGEFTALFWQIQSSLERNLITSHDQRTTGDNPLQFRWKRLLDRSERYRRLVVDLRGSPVQVDRLQQEPPRQVLPSRKFDLFDRHSISTEDNQRGLDRVSYLGGVLLPISIVSGILSMGETFGPRGDMFYVFWAAAVPSTILTLLVIYADSIRQEVVWVETTVAGASSEHEVFGRRPIYARKHKRLHRSSTPNIEQGVPYSYSEPVTVPISERFNNPVPDHDVQSVASEPTAVLQQRFGGDKKPKAWKRRELGWTGAAMCILQLSRVKKTQKLPSGMRR